MVTNKDRVSMMFGKTVADMLDEQGLIRHDFWQARKPTHWTVRARLMPATPLKWPPHNLNGEFSALIRAHVNANRGYISATHLRSSAEILFNTERSARRAATMAMSAGLFVETIPSILLPVKDVG